MRYYLIVYQPSATYIEATFPCKEELLNYLAWNSEPLFLWTDDEQEIQRLLDEETFFWLNHTAYTNQIVRGQNLSIHDKLSVKNNTVYHKSNNQTDYGWLCIDETGKHLDLHAYADEVKAIVSDADKMKRIRKTVYPRSVAWQTTRKNKSGTYYRHNRYGHIQKAIAVGALAKEKYQNASFDYGHAYRKTYKSWKHQSHYRHQWEARARRQKKEIQSYVCHHKQTNPVQSNPFRQTKKGRLPNTD